MGKSMEYEARKAAFEKGEAICPICNKLQGVNCVKCGQPFQWTDCIECTPDGHRHHIECPDKPAQKDCGTSNCPIPDGDISVFDVMRLYNQYCRNCKSNPNNAKGITNGN